MVVLIGSKNNLSIGLTKSALTMMATVVTRWTKPIGVMIKNEKWSKTDLKIEMMINN